MSIIDNIGDDTISRLERAAVRRKEEADLFAKSKSNLLAIYLYGHVIEIILGMAYFRMRGYHINDPIIPEERKRVLNSARLQSKMLDKSHPIDGLALLLIDEKARFYAPAYDKRIELRLRKYSSLIRDNWSPRLRYRAMDIREEQVIPVQNSAHWFLDNSKKL